MRWSRVCPALFLLLMSVPARAGVSPQAEVVDAFMAALAHADLTALRPLVAPSANDSEWSAARDLVEAYDCISIDRYTWHLEETAAADATIELRIWAAGTVRGAPRRIRTIPLVWDLVLRNDGGRWSIVSISPREHSLAFCIVEDASVRALQEAESSGEIDLPLLWREIAQQTSLPPHGSTDHFLKEAGWLQLFEHVIRASAAAGDLVTSTFATRMLSRHHWMGHDFNAAIRVGRDSLRMARAAGDPDETAGALFMVGMSLLLGGDRPAGFRTLAESAALIDEVNDPRLPLKSLRMEEYYHQEQGDFRESLVLMERFTRLSREYGWTEGEIVGEWTTGDLYRLLRNVELVRGHYERAAFLADSVGRAPMAGDILESLYWAELASGHPDRAAELLPRFVDRREFYSGFRSVAQVRQAIENHQYEQAERAIKAGMSSTGPGEHDPTLLSFFSDLRRRQGRFQEALDLSRRALEAGKSDAVHSEWPVWWAQTLAGQALAGLNRPEEAIAACRQAIDQIENRLGQLPLGDMGKTQYLQDKALPYTELVDLLVRSGRTGEAVEAAESLRGRALRDALAQGHVDRTAPMTPKEKEQEQLLNARLRELNGEILTARQQGKTSTGIRSELEAARLALSEFEARMELDHPPLRIPVLSAGVAGIQLPPSLGSVAVLEYVVGERRTIVFILRRTAAGETRITARTIPIARDALGELVLRLTRQIANRELRYRTAARELYDLLLQPAEEAIGSRRQIAIIPDGLLWRLPFHALLRRDGTPLIERRSVAYAPSLRMLLATAAGRHRAETDARTLLAFGNPLLSGPVSARVRTIAGTGTLLPLPDAAREVQALRTLYGQRHSRVYVGEAAREAVFKQEAEHSRIVHLATHALLDDGAPMYSALLLAPGGDDDGLLEAREIVNLRLDADVAVLAACNTGQGEIRTGEGVIGMSWAFLVAGCPATVVSQWEAVSETTSRLMVDFHRHLQTGKAPAEALRRAELALMRDPHFGHPYYWAPFVVVGAGW
jgi:CHAT domain-containing protein